MNNISGHSDDPRSLTLTILIIDDKPANLSILSDYLDQAGYQVMVARDGKSGLQMAKNVQPDLILLDVIMPGIDGFETCLQLKADNRTQDIPVIFTTILGDTADKIKGFEVGGVDYIAKPFQYEEVLARVATHLHIRSLTQKLEEAKTSLEEQVKSRTAELVQTNQALEAEITERKQIEAALRNNEARFRALYHDNPSMFFTLDRNGVMVAVNTFGAKQLGYTIEELEGKSVTEIVHEDDRADITIQLKQCLQNPWQTMQWQFRKIHKNGRILWVEEHARAIEEPEGDVHVLIICQDITNRKQADLERVQLLEQIREQAQMMQNIIDTVPQGVLLLQENLRIRMTNPTGEQFLEILAPQWQNRRLTHFGSTPLSDLLTSPPKGLWHEITADDYRFEVIARPVENGPTNQGWVIVLRDITHERSIQKHIQEQERLAAVGQLAAGIAHDFNNILTVIYLYAQLTLQTTGIPAQLQSRIEIIEQQSLRARDLVQQILDFSRQSMLERQPLDLVLFLTELIRLLQRTLPENIQIELIHTEDSFVIFADPSRIQQVFMNLGVNARDALLKGGQITITLSSLQITPKSPLRLPGMPPGEWLKINFTDNGDGIPLDILPHIFEPFFTTKGIEKGTGLGLAQVYGIVQQHDGVIDVHSEIGHGTTFSIYLPAHMAQDQKDMLPLTDTLPKGQKQLVMLVEDETSTRQALVDTLTMLNYTVMEARNGSEALILLQQYSEEIAVILSDAVMPEMGGIALFHAMQKLDLDIPFVIITGHVMEREIEMLRKQGLHGWLVKPPDLPKLASLLAQILAD